jgi:ell wall binding domain 2 (CWB2)
VARSKVPRRAHVVRQAGALSRVAWIAAGIVVVAAIGVGAYFAIQELSEDEDEAPAPPVAVKHEDDDEPQAAEELGFPAFATKNTTRVGGDDPTADAAGVALATFPSAGGIEGPAAVTFVPSSDWAAGIAASVLVSDPIRAPVLLGDRDGVPDQTETAIKALDPPGSPETSDAQAFRIGEVRPPGELRTMAASGDDPARLADSIDKLRQRLADADPRHVLLVSTEEPAFAMPAAAWAARSGDPVLFVERDAVPEATEQALKRHDDTPAFVLGPESVVSEKVFGEVEKIAPSVQRVSGHDPVANAIAFARFEAGGFGWNITDPGHGLVIANTAEPLDAAAAASLSASGKWGPLLVTEDADSVPAELRGFLLDIKPGYLNDPTRAFYNHAWLIGDSGDLSVGFQAQVDDALELAQIQAAPGSKPGAAEREANP